MTLRNGMSALKKWSMVLAGMLLLVAVMAMACGGDGQDSADGPSDGGDRYEVTVRFNTSVTQEDIDAVEARLRGYDDGLDFVVMESFPPVGRAILTVYSAGFCATVESELEAASYVDEVSCAPSQTPTSGDPDEPVSHDNEPTAE